MTFGAVCLYINTGAQAQSNVNWLQREETGPRLCTYKTCGRTWQIYSLCLCHLRPGLGLFHFLKKGPRSLLPAAPKRSHRTTLAPPCGRCRGLCKAPGTSAGAQAGFGFYNEVKHVTFSILATVTFTIQGCWSHPRCCATSSAVSKQTFPSPRQERRRAAPAHPGPCGSAPGIRDLARPGIPRKPTTQSRPPARVWLTSRGAVVGMLIPGVTGV